MIGIRGEERVSSVIQKSKLSGKFGKDLLLFKTSSLFFIFLSGAWHSVNHCGIKKVSW